MKIYLKIIKGFGIFLLLFVMVSAAAASDSTYRVSVTILSSSSEDGDEANTVISTYTMESDSPGTNVKSVISGSGSSVITNKEDTTEEDTTPTKSTDSGVMPDFQIGELTPEEYNDELSEWISFMINDKDMLLAIDDFPQDVTDIIGVE